MSAQIEVQVGSRMVVVRELNAVEVRAWLAEVQAGRTVDPVRAAYFDDCSLDDLEYLCDMPAEEMELYPVSQLMPLRDKAKALNPHFFKVREAVMAVSRLIDAETALTNSTAPSSP